ncbi:PREDICTED: uncharacterized protein C1orf101 homolog [Aptenodytes forsteri]|uniref:uncharacterized protein C1orf101 homolog n=1 Tax=Aptenodytes forsteri TaxID=9233 RepID=UPI00090527F5|nr:PREDICTED: uncharacterized protein C1orf101 homolog [Aptenodytes forsteri]
MRWKYQVFAFFLTERAKLILWIYDPESTDASKLNHTAIIPSQSSQILGRLFWNLGQEPVVHIYLKKEKYCSQEHPKLGLWTVDVPAISDDIVAKIHGKPTVFQECFVLDTPFIIPRPKQSFPSKENYTSLCSSQNSDLSVKWSACFLTTAVLLSNFGTFYTNDRFKTYIEIKVPSDALTQGLNNNVTNVALTDNGIIFLINGTFCSSIMRMIYINAALSPGLLWDDMSVYYTYKTNTDNGYFQVSGSNLSRSEMSHGSTIHQLILDYFGNILIKMKSYILFAARTGLKELVKLPVWISGKKNMVLYLNPSANVYMLLTDGSRIYHQTYPLEIEIFSSTFSSEDSCSVVAFQHSMDLNVYYLDMGDEVTFWSLKAFEKKVAVSTSLEVYFWPTGLSQTYYN